MRLSSYIHEYPISKSDRLSFLLIAFLSLNFPQFSHAYATITDKTVIPLRGIQDEIIINIQPLDTLYGHDVQQYSLGVSFSTSIGLFATIGQAGILLWDFETGKLQRVLMTRDEMNSHTGKLNAALFSPDGKWFALAGEKCVSLWDIQKQEEIWSRTDLVKCATLHFSSDSSLLFIGKPPENVSLLTFQRQDYLVYHERGDIVNTKTGVSRYSFLSSFVPWYPFSSNNKHFVITNSEKTKVIIRHLTYDTQTTIDVHPIDSEASPFNYLAFLPNSDQLITRTYETKESVEDPSRSLDIWDSINGNLLRSLYLDLPIDSYYVERDDSLNNVQMMCLTPDTSSIIGAFLETDLWGGLMTWEQYYWDLMNGTLSRVVDYGPYSDGSWLVPYTFALHDTILLFKSDAIVVIKTFPEQNILVSYHCRSSALSPNTEYLYNADTGNSTYDAINKIDLNSLYNENILTIKQIQYFQNPSNNYSSAAFTHNSKILTIGTVLFDANSWLYNSQFRYKSNCSSGLTISSQKFSPNDLYFISNYANGIFLWDSETKEQIACATGTVYDNRLSFNFSHQGNTFLSATGKENEPGRENLVQIWDLSEFKVIKSLEGHTDSVWYAAFSPDDQRIVSASLDGTAKVWNVESGSLVSEFIGHATGVVYAEFLPDGLRVLSAGNDRRALIWNTETATVEQTIENIHLPVQLSPDGKYLFAGSEVWELASGQVIKTLDGISQDYTCLTLSPDGTLLLTSETNGFTKVWNVQEHIFGSSGIQDFERY